MEKSRGRSLTARQRYWLEHVQACEAAGRGMKAYAAEHGLKARAFYDAKKRLRQRGLVSPKRGNRRFHRAEVVVAPNDGHQQCRILLPNGAVIELGGDRLDLSLLLQAVSALR